MAASIRAFTLPSTVDTENVKASYNAGILKLELNKKAEAQPKQIKVNVGGQSKLEDKKEAAGTGRSTVRRAISCQF